MGKFKYHSEYRINPHFEEFLLIFELLRSDEISVVGMASVSPELRRLVEIRKILESHPKGWDRGIVEKISNGKKINTNHLNPTTNTLLRILQAEGLLKITDMGMEGAKKYSGKIGLPSFIRTAGLPKSIRKKKQQPIPPIHAYAADEYSRQVIKTAFDSWKRKNQQELLGKK